MYWPIKLNLKDWEKCSIPSTYWGHLPSLGYLNQKMPEKALHPAKPKQKLPVWEHRKSGPQRKGPWQILTNKVESIPMLPDKCLKPRGLWEHHQSNHIFDQGPTTMGSRLKGFCNHLNREKHYKAMIEIRYVSTCTYIQR